MMSPEKLFKTAPDMSCKPDYAQAKLDTKRMSSESFFIHKTLVTATYETVEENGLFSVYQPIKNEKLRTFFALNNHQNGLYQFLSDIKTAITVAIMGNQQLSNDQKEEAYLSLFEVGVDSLKIEINPIEGSKTKYQYTATTKASGTKEDFFSVSCSVEIDEANQKVIVKDKKITLSQKAADYLGVTQLVYEYPDEISYSLNDAIKYTLEPDDFAREFREKNADCLQALTGALNDFLENPANAERKKRFQENLLKLYKALDLALRHDGYTKHNYKIDVLRHIFKQKVCKNLEISQVALFNQLFIEADKSFSIKHGSEELALSRIYGSLLESARETYPLSRSARNIKEKLLSDLDRTTYDLFAIGEINSIKHEIEGFFDNRLFCSEESTNNAIQNIQNVFINDDTKIPAELDFEAIKSALKKVRREFFNQEINHIFQQSWEKEKSKLDSLVDTHCKENNALKAKLKNKIENHMKIMKNFLDERSHSMMNKHESESIIEFIKKRNSDFMANIASELPDDSKTEVESRLISLQVKSTQPFVHSVIKNVNKDGDKLMFEGKDKEAVLKKGLVQNLTKKSNDFYGREEITSQDASGFFQEFESAIKKQEKSLDVSDKTDIGILSILYKIADVAKDCFVSSRDYFASMFGFFADTNPTKNACETVKTISEQFSPEKLPEYYIPVM